MAAGEGMDPNKKGNINISITNLNPHQNISLTCDLDGINHIKQINGQIEAEPIETNPNTIMPL